jgi:hypothetical protein
VQQLHFVTSADNKVGKSWFIRGAVEYLRQSFRVVVVDTSSDRRLGSIYNPHFNDLYSLRFGDDNSLLADRLIDLAQHDLSVIIKVPASDRTYFEQWAADIELSELGIDIYYWFVGKGDRQVLSIPKSFDDRWYYIRNQYVDRDNTIENEIHSKIFTLPRFASTRDTKTIESTNQSLKNLILSPSTSVVVKTRVRRFLAKIDLELSQILSI